MEKAKVLTARDLAGKNVLVVGLARSGIAACRVLGDAGAVVRATDKRPAEAVGADLAALRRIGVEVEVGGHTRDFAAGCEIVVVSPGVPLDTGLVKWARGRGKLVMGEVELAWCLSDAVFVAVTGTNGKTTTASLLGEILKRHTDKVRVGGNIGDPISALAAGLGPDWTLVIEISSFQLDTCLSFSPKVAVLLNVTPDHLDRYESYEAYVQSKARIFMNQVDDDFAIVNGDDKDALRAARDAASRRLYFSLVGEVTQGAFVRDETVVVRLGKQETTLFATEDPKIRGPHNLANSLAASLAATVLDTPPATIREALRSFAGLEHRLEPVASVGGIGFINDSKATNVDSLRWALETATEPVVLIAGGRDKGGDFTQVLDLVRRKVKAIVAVGEATEKLEKTFSSVVKVVAEAGFEEAVRRAYGLAVRGEIVLLSPGCASYDMFRGFEHRGEVFKAIVMKLKQESEGNLHG
ncbi:MAG TPA: UDP-N-acetylmuramoyl-L-alanine--D-glutamate ligase [bacterium]|nr:UDP-N-acetylmuramoyl-L-alanine--D-glutamate ligase [bacterium]